MEIKNVADHKAIWMQTEKAINYLRRKGCGYYTETVETDFGMMLLKYSVCGADEKAKAHVAKTYPLALISYVCEDSVKEEYGRRDADFFSKFGVLPSRNF